MSKREPLEIRFWRKVKKSSDPNGCWEWQASIGTGGYGQIGPDFDGSNRRPLRAHRVSWTIHFGKIDDGLVICHHCDNRKCVRPDHLFIGTQKDNMQDALSKGRAGKNNPNLSKWAQRLSEPEKAVWQGKLSVALKRHWESNPHPYPQCKKDGCDRDATRKGFCHSHYQWEWQKKKKGLPTSLVD